MDYGYDATSNLTSMTSNDSLLNQSWTYDGLNRLKTETRYPANTSVDYDVLGNITSKSKGSQSLVYSYDFSRNRLSNVSGTFNYSFNYDVYGNVMVNGRNSFEYDHASNLISVKTIAGSILKKHVYDGNNKRIVDYSSSNSLQKYTVYNSAGNLMHESSWTGIPTNTVYIYLGNQLIATESQCITCGTSSPTVTYFNNDILGSPIQASTQNGAVLWDAKYDPYGEKHSLAQNNLGYTGHVLDTNTGLTYMQARYYDGLLGRFMGIDPVGFNERNPMSFNRYSYGNNNPYKYTDPDGRIAFLAPLLWGIGVGGLFGYSDYANAPVEASDIHTKPAYEPMLAVAGAPALKGLGSLGDDALKGLFEVKKHAPLLTWKTLGKERQNAVNAFMTQFGKRADGAERLLDHINRNGVPDGLDLEGLRAYRDQIKSVGGNKVKVIEKDVFKTRLEILNRILGK